jgi:CheY-like chemotaxis protein
MKPVERVLVIDDDATVTFLTKRMLNSLGIRSGVRIAHNGLEGLECIKEAAEQGLLPQLVLLDIKMPVMDGFAFLEELAKLNLNLSDTKVVLLTSSQSPWDKERAAKSQADALLYKPLTKETLQSIMM